MKTERLIGILSVLLQKEQVTAPELAEMFEVSRRTISRDIDALSAAGIPLYTLQGTGGGIRIMPGYRFDRTVLTNKDMQELLTGLRSLDSISGTNRYVQLMEKLSAGSSVVRADSHILINLAAWNKTAVSQKIELIRMAAEQGKKLHFHYSSPKGESERVIEPYDLVFEWSRWYVWGWCEKRQDYRLFKLNRMTEIRTGDPFVKRDEPLPDLSNEKVFPEQYRVKAVVQPAYRWRVLEEYGPESMTEMPDGTFLFSFGFTDRQSILSWILSFREGIELLEPADLRGKLKQFGEHLTEKYRDMTD